MSFNSFNCVDIPFHGIKIKNKGFLLTSKTGLIDINFYCQMCFVEHNNWTKKDHRRCKSGLFFTLKWIISSC